MASGLLLALSVNSGVYNMLLLTSMLTCMCMPLRRVPGALLVALPALLFILYVTLTPGRLFADMPLGVVMLTAFLTGAGFVLFSPTASGLPCLRLGMFVLLLSLFVQTLWFCLSGSQDLLWNYRLSLVFDHPNVLGYVAAWVMFFGFISLPDMWRRSSVWRYIWLVAVAGAVIIVAFAGSRGVYIGVILGFIPVLFSVNRRWCVRILLAGLVGGALVFAVLPDRHQERLLSAIHNPLEDVALQGRLPIWKAALEGFHASPLFGNGLRTFSSYHAAYVEKNWEMLAATSPYLESRVANPHNLYLGLLYAYGGVGVLLLLVFMGNAVFVAVRRRTPEDLFFLASFLFLCGAGVVDYSLHRKEGIMILMIPAGMVYARSVICRFQSYSTLPSKEK